MRVVGLEPTYREDQYELFVEAGRFYRPLPLHSQFISTYRTFMSPMPDSNQRPSHYKWVTLPTELIGQIQQLLLRLTNIISTDVLPSAIVIKYFGIVPPIDQYYKYWCFTLGNSIMIWKFCFLTNYIFVRIYLLNYTVKILNISLVVVFHQTSSVSVLLYFIVPTCQRTQFVIRYCYIHFTNII